MNMRSRNLLLLVSTGAAGIVLTHSTEAATILTGSGLGNNTALPANHGSNAVGTPDIALAWSATGSRRWEAYTGWPSGGGDVYQLDGPGSGYTGAANYIIALTPSSGSISVLLSSVVLNDYAGPSTESLKNTTLNWNVTGSLSGLLGSGTGLVVPDGTAPVLNFGIQGVGGETLTLTLTPTGGSGSYFAIDNLSFDQVAVPEPASALLAAAGLGAAALRRRRRAE